MTEEVYFAKVTYSLVLLTELKRHLDSLGYVEPRRSIEDIIRRLHKEHPSLPELE